MQTFELGQARHALRDGADRVFGPVARWVAGKAPTGLLTRVRWLFLMFVVWVTLTTPLALTEVTVGPPAQTAGLALVAVCGGWAVYRYKRPAAPLWTDLIAPAALATMGWVVQSPRIVVGPAFILLFFRAMYGTRRQALANGVLYYAALHVPIAILEGTDELLTIGSGSSFAGFLIVALVMQALGEAAGGHEEAARREQILTEISGHLLRARTPEQVHASAAEGARRLARVPDASASVWTGGETMHLCATAGPDLLDLREAPLSTAPPALLERFLQGEPYMLEGEEALTLQDAYSHPRRFAALLIAQLRSGDDVVGVIMLASPSPLDRSLVEFMGRFSNEVSLANERAQLIGDLERANSELRQADELKNQFLSTVSHELRTPLTSIRGFAHTLRRKAALLSDEQRDRFLEIIERQSMRQLRLVEDLLTTSRMVAGRLRTDATTVQLAPFFSHLLEDLQVDPAHVRLECPADAQVHVDPMHLHQILANLFTNAQKYGAPPYTMEVATRPDLCVLAFTDAGPGIPESFRPSLFEPFTQADAGDRRTAAGTGLGLAIIRTLVEANGGTITHRADLPGACFEIRLPSQDPDAPRGSARAHASEAPSTHAEPAGPAEAADPRPEAGGSAQQPSFDDLEALYA